MFFASIMINGEGRVENGEYYIWKSLIYYIFLHTFYLP